MSRFKIGDRVTLNENFDKVRTKGMKGVITEVAHNYDILLYVTFDNGAESNGMYSSRFIKDTEVPSTIDVDTLGYQVEYKSGKFFIGCQTVSFEDANKVADFIKSQVKEKFMVVQFGDRFTESSQEYIVSYVGADEVALINLKTGFRWSDPIKLVTIDYNTLSEETARKLLGNNKFTKVEKCK